MNVSVNVPRILQAMEAKQLKIVDACVVCGVNNKTLAKILRGESLGVSMPFTGF